MTVGYKKQPTISTTTEPTMIQVTEDTRVNQDLTKVLQNRTTPSLTDDSFPEDRQKSPNYSEQGEKTGKLEE